MVTRKLWLKRIQKAWRKAPVVWLSGVRRIGKTTLSKSIPDALYLNCDLPSVARLLKEPEQFYDSVKESVIIFDEVHQLDNPSLLLKIGADEYPGFKILATGSSTLAATKKFKDALTGRKRVVHLLPVLINECRDFGIKDIRHRLFHGGLPEQLISDERDLEFYAEWLDSFYARDIQELFRVEKRQGFLKLIELLLRNSGSMLDITNISKHCGLSRPTVMHYLEILQITYVLTMLRPYHAGGRQELVRQPKMYGFDTGFVCYAKGWNELRPEDCGILWEHLVLDILKTLFLPDKIYFWRDKQKREVDFVIPIADEHCIAIECKWNPDSFDTKNLHKFRQSHQLGSNYVVSPLVQTTYTRTIRGLKITFCNLVKLVELLAASK